MDLVDLAFLNSEKGDDAAGFGIGTLRYRWLLLDVVGLSPLLFLRAMRGYHCRRCLARLHLLSPLYRILAPFYVKSSRGTYWETDRAWWAFWSNFDSQFLFPYSPSHVITATLADFYPIKVMEMPRLANEMRGT